MGLPHILSGARVRAESLGDFRFEGRGGGRCLCGLGLAGTGFYVLLDLDGGKVSAEVFGDGGWRGSRGVFVGAARRRALGIAGEFREKCRASLDAWRRYAEFVRERGGTNSGRLWPELYECSFCK